MIKSAKCIYDNFEQFSSRIFLIDISDLFAI